MKGAQDWILNFFISGWSTPIHRFWLFRKTPDNNVYYQHVAYNNTLDMNPFMGCKKPKKTLENSTETESLKGLTEHQIHRLGVWFLSGTCVETQVKPSHFTLQHTNCNRTEKKCRIGSGIEPGTSHSIGEWSTDWATQTNTFLPCYSWVFHNQVGNLTQIPSDGLFTCPPLPRTTLATKL